MDKKNEGQELTRGQERRLQRKKEVAAAKRKALLSRILAIVIGVAVIGGAAFAIGYGIYTQSTTTTPSDDFSAYLTDEGFIEGVNVADNVSTIDHTALNIPLSEVEYTDEEVETAIQSALSSHSTLVTDSAIAAADGDRVNVDYVGYVDGVAFDGGNTNGAGSTITIGSGSLIDDFEQQLIGAHPGDNVTVNVTFPEEYSNNPDLAGQDATFEVTVNGVYVLPEYNDEFVAQYYSSYATTADGYRAYLKETNYDSNLTTYIQEYIADNTTASSYPSSYMRHLRSLFRYSDEATYEYYNQMAYAYYGEYMYETFEDYTQLSDSEYEDLLVERAETQTALDMAYQLIFEKAGLSISDADYEAYATESGEEATTNYGKPYMMKTLIWEKVIEYLKSIAVVA